MPMQRSIEIATNVYTDAITETVCKKGTALHISNPNVHSNCIKSMEKINEKYISSFQTTL